jgi:ADP-ribose pyrophosphatase YjhB (NUDIX family)
VKPVNFCASCGSVLQHIDCDGGAPCSACGRRWYRNPAPTVGAAIVRDGRALVAVRARNPEQGKIDVPGGFLHEGEQPTDGLRREVREELGIEVEVRADDIVQAVAHRYGPNGEWLVSLGYKVRMSSGEPQPNDDVAEIRWVTLAELDDLHWAWGHDDALVRRALEDG